MTASGAPRPHLAELSASPNRRAAIHRLLAMLGQDFEGLTFSHARTVPPGGAAFELGLPEQELGCIVVGGRLPDPREERAVAELCLAAGPVLAGLAERPPERSAAATAPAAPSAATDAAGKPRLLIVEDDRINQMAFRHFLERRGYRVLCANDGYEALDTLRENAVDCVLMDIQMPGINGLQTTRRIREDPQFESLTGVPILAVTAHCTPEDERRYRAAGMDGMVAKPLDFVELETAVRRATGEDARTG